MVEELGQAYADSRTIAYDMVLTPALDAAPTIGRFVIAFLVKPAVTLVVVLLMWKWSSAFCFRTLGMSFYVARAVTGIACAIAWPVLSVVWGKRTYRPSRLPSPSEDESLRTTRPDDGYRPSEDGYHF